MDYSEKIGVKVPQILLPGKSVDLTRWAVIACDQFTSQPEYWQRVSEFVGEAPSTLRMILPEVWLHSPDVQERIAATQNAMREYLRAGIFEAHDGFILVEREHSGQVQTGLMVALDLETYDYNKGSQTLIRATEGTILDRLPPRMQVRRGAPLELPHILVLYDDPEFQVLSKVVEVKARLPLCYDFELMFGSGRLQGRLVSEPELIESVFAGLNALIEPELFASKYQLPAGTPPLLFAMGDGNHSLATAKAIWEELKPTAGPDHPARYALVEIVNLHDPAIIFEAIHRVLFNVQPDFMRQIEQAFSPHIQFTESLTFEQMTQAVLSQQPNTQRIGCISHQGFSVMELTHPSHNLPVGSLQEYLDAYLQNHPETRIDYVHGDETVRELGGQRDNFGFYLPPIAKDSFFKTVLVDGALPRKTFSMGHAKDKRFYMECRRISP
ncbi:MAG: DUF1015 domain-containing protein [Chloroflexi bacterium]|mgnify:FL=1|jgi:hypothetical protein|nr:DUF1015 domain-containing protein [Anaerolineaceae bacterium]NLI44111.1 DUF1015 domain-containing protein [Chloroflexota bacterium]HOT24828.1 DUF1015 domain-containing protein [Anaerolineaceae bacterium]HQH57597.1 DUF1015 domain-containing protein [Anaerolineaceae bacterium]HQK03155.1 DUF1015 domain-containing protein [Anaerolineaceae bacterium]